MKFQTENSQRETFKKFSRQQIEQSQQDDKSFQGTIYCIGALILFLLFIFWLQLKAQIQDQNLFQKEITSPNNQPKIQSKIDMEVSIKQNQTAANIDDAKEIKRMLDGAFTIQQNFDFLFWSLENWDRKNSYQNTPQNQAKQKIQQTKYIPFKNSPFNFYNIKPSPPKVSSPIYPNKPNPIPASVGLRAGLKAQQVDLAKRLVNIKNISMSSDLAQEQKKYYEEKYNISKFEELPFCLVVPSYNNSQSQRYINNMNSILQQDYSNYHIVFIDDASQDGTGNLIKQYAKNHQVSQKKLKIIINPNRTMAMPNIYRAAKQFCKPYEIFIIVDGDDQLLGRQVLKFLNSVYQVQQKWVVYTNFLSIRGSIGYSRPYSQTVIQSNSFRKAGFVISHLRSFYTKLLTLVQEKDFHDDQGNWFRAANDVAMYIPILQMTHRKVAYIPQITYLYNSNTGLNNHKVKLKQQKANQKKVKSRAPYQQLNELFTEEQKQQLNQSMNDKIQIKDLTLPQPQQKQKIKVFGWELE